MAELEVATAGEGATDEAAAAADVAVDIVPARTMKKSELMHTQQQRRSMYVICFFFPPCVLLFPFFFFKHNTSDGVKCSKDWLYGTPVAVDLKAGSCNVNPPPSLCSTSNTRTFSFKNMKRLSLSLSTTIGMKENGTLS